MANGTIYLTTSSQALLAKLAQIIDIAEGYDISVRHPGYVTQRYADIETKPDATTYAFPFDDVVWKWRTQILAELAKYGISQAAIANKAQRIRDAVSTNETVTFTSGLFGGVTLTWQPKDATWTPTP